MLAAPQIARNLPFLALTGLLAAAGCNVEGDNFDDNFSDAANGGVGVAGTADEDEDDTPEDDEPAAEEPAADDGPTGFAHEGSFIGTCTFGDAEEGFQVDLELDQWGLGFLRRHDLGPFELEAAGLTDEEGITIVEALRDDIVFRVQIYPDTTGGLVAECMELTPAEGEGDMQACMFDSIGCLAAGNYDLTSSGELTLIRK